MASIADKHIINNIKYDRRVKLTPEDKLEIQKVYKEGLLHFPTFKPYLKI